jgi:hypothetical protein
VGTRPQFLRKTYRRSQNSSIDAPVDNIFDGAGGDALNLQVEFKLVVSDRDVVYTTDRI